MTNYVLFLLPAWSDFTYYLIIKLRNIIHVQYKFGITEKFQYVEYFHFFPWYACYNKQLNDFFEWLEIMDFKEMAVLSTKMAAFAESGQMIHFWKLSRKRTQSISTQIAFDSLGLYLVILCLLWLGNRYFSRHKEQYIVLPILIGLEHWPHFLWKEGIPPNFTLWRQEGWSSPIFGVLKVGQRKRSPFVIVLLIAWSCHEWFYWDL